MVNVLWQGTVLGFTVALVLGPAFFALLQTSIHRGFHKGLHLAIGIVLSDAMLVALSMLGILQVVNEPKNQVLVGVIGGSILLMFGFYNTFRKYDFSHSEDNVADDITLKIKTPSSFLYIFKGFILNSMNPFLWIFWMASMGLVSSNYGGSKEKLMIFFAATLVAIFATDILKCFIANKIKKYLKPIIMLWLNRFMGLLLIIFGVVMIVRVLL